MSKGKGNPFAKTGMGSKVKKDNMEKNGEKKPSKFTPFKKGSKR